MVSEAGGYAEINMDAIANQKILDFKSWGKHFFICFSDFTIRIHFGLFGTYQFHEPKKVEPKIALHFNDDSIYFYVCKVERLDIPPEKLYDFEADVMGDAWNPAKALSRLGELPGKKICDVLLDQHIFSGVGNIIKNEVLFRCKVHPESLVGKIPVGKLGEIIEECRIYSFDFLRWRRNNELSRHYEVYLQKHLKDTPIAVIKKDTGTTKRSSYFIPELQELYI